jgi:hypothetical protein
VKRKRPEPPLPRWLPWLAWLSVGLGIAVCFGAFPTPATTSHVLMEADRALQQCPDGATSAWTYKTEALRLLGGHQEAFEAQLKIPTQLVFQ